MGLSLCVHVRDTIGALWLLAWEQRAELLGKGAHTLASMGLTDTKVMHVKGLVGEKWNFIFNFYFFKS